MSNPFTLRPVCSEDYFVPSRGGRGAQAQRLVDSLARTDPLADSVSLVAERRFGKTSLLLYLKRCLAGVPGVVTTAIDMLSLHPQCPAGFYEMLTRSLVRAGELPSGQPPLSFFDFQDLLHELDDCGKRLLLFIDEFDVVARERRFDLGFFDNLRSAANTLPLVLVVASVQSLSEIAHRDVLGSPFFNIFQKERLGLLSLEEGRALITQPPHGDGWGGRGGRSNACNGRKAPFLPPISRQVCGGSLLGSGSYT
ncbi:hypothetical protein ACFL5Q_03610 [Planctomycetota bacterium]